jgi:hypothetical protein
MGNEETEIRNILYNSERSLLLNSVRNDKKRISELLDEHFKEYTSSGKVYSYIPGDIFGNNQNEIAIIESTFEVTALSSDIKLVTYQTLTKDNKIKTCRSSIWKRLYNKWIIVFHQGTLSSETNT